jgi:mRNA interferase RelE/StbE
MAYRAFFSKIAFQDVQKLPPKLRQKLQEIITQQILPDPYAGKKLVGDLKGLYSVKLTYQNRIVYSIDQEHQIVYIHRARTHYGE